MWTQPLALDFLRYGQVTSLAQTVDLCAEVGWDRCGILLDTWHFFTTGAPWDELSQLEGRHVALVHVNDAVVPAGADLQYESLFRRLLPGREGLRPAAVLLGAGRDRIRGGGQYGGPVREPHQPGPHRGVIAPSCRPGRLRGDPATGQDTSLAGRNRLGPPPEPGRRTPGQLLHLAGAETIQLAKGHADRLDRASRCG